MQRLNAHEPRRAYAAAARPGSLTTCAPPAPIARRHKPLPTLDQLQVMYQANPETMSEEDKKRMIRQWNRKRIKDSNALKAKK